MATSKDVPSSISDPLLSFTESFNFRKFARDHLPSSESDSARLIGQEKDGSILFAWDQVSNESGDRATNVGLYQKNIASFSNIYQHETVDHIMAATVNQERTLIAFTIEIKDEESLYDSFIAEIKPQNRVFTLNIASTEFRKLQFLYPGPGPSKNVHRSQQANLLLIVPQAFVCLYKIKMQAVRNGAVMATQPEKDVILQNFDWYQFDPNPQYLYHARFETFTNSEATQTKASGGRSAKSKASPIGMKYALFFNCLRFVDGTSKLMFSVSLPLPYPVTLYTRATTYYKSPFALTLPVRERTLQVLHRRDGFWCVCVQHCTGAGGDSKLEEGSKIDYSVFILHNGSVLYGQVPLSASANESLYIHFMLIGCFVVAYIPGFMLHLLNVGPRVDPCHHLTLGTEHAMFLPKQPESVRDRYSKDEDEIIQGNVVLTSATSFSLLGDYSISVLDSASGVMYECSLDVPGFLTLFKTCKDQEMREDLLHLVIVGFSNPGMAISMIEHVCHTPMSFSDHKLFAEFVIASSYANVYLSAKPVVARQLPLTMSPTYRGKVYKNTEGIKLAYLKISPIQNFIQQLLVQSDQRLVMASLEDLLNHTVSPDHSYDLLCFNALINSSNRFARIDMRALSQSTDEQRQGQGATGTSQERAAKKGATPRQLISPTQGILGKITHSLSRRQAPIQNLIAQSGKDPQDMLWFLDSDEDLLDGVSADGVQVRERMLSAMGRDLPLKARNTVYTINAAYYTELCKQSCTLLYTIWSSLGFTIDSHPLNLVLCRNPSPKEQILYELLEAFHLAHLDIGLHPPSGFHTLFNSMAFICLEGSLFLQHLHNGVLTPTRRFVDMLLDDCSDEADAEIVFHIFSSLDYRLATYAMEKWHNPTIETMTVSSQLDSRSKPH